MKNFEFRGIIGQLLYSEKDKIYFGTFENKHGYFGYHGSTEEEAIETFKDTVNAYFEYCEEENLTPYISELIHIA